jgi:hypothetical protein
MLKDYVVRYEVNRNYPGIAFLMQLVDNAPSDYFIIRDSDMVRVCELCDMQELEEEPPVTENEDIEV